MLTRISLLMIALAPFRPAAAEDFFQDGDLVVLLGGTLVERAQEYGHWEAALQLANPDKTLRFRNFGWSGDTVWAESRGQFDPPAEGYKRMIQQVTASKPDMLILGYGNAEAFDGPGKLEAFSKQYRQLLKDLPDVRILHLLPLPPGPGFEGAADYRESVELYSQAVREVADGRGERTLPVILPAPYHRRAYEPNQLHLNESGYHFSSGVLLNQLGDRGSVDLTAKDGGAGRDSLLDAIRRKNRLVFDRWRPQNVTYLFGFRKHEQGQNAAEIPRFDPLIEKADEEIRETKRKIIRSADG